MSTKTWSLFLVKVSAAQFSNSNKRNVELSQKVTRTYQPCGNQALGTPLLTRHPMAGTPRANLGPVGDTGCAIAPTLDKEGRQGWGAMAISPRHRSVRSACVPEGDRVQILHKIAIQHTTAYQVSGGVRVLVLHEHTQRNEPLRKTANSSQQTAKPPFPEGLGWTSVYCIWKDEV